MGTNPQGKDLGQVYYPAEVTSNQDPLPAEIGVTRAREMLMRMALIRAFEEKAEELYALGRVHGTMHLSIGQEATAVGAANALRPGDYLLIPAHCRHRVEWTDPAGDVERITTSKGSVPGFDVVKLGLASDGTRLPLLPKFFWIRPATATRRRPGVAGGTTLSALPGRHAGPGGGPGARSGPGRRCRSSADIRRACPRSPSWPPARRI